MTESRLEQLQEFLEKATSIADLARMLEQPGEPELLKRISLLRYFDETIFNQYLRKHLPEGAPDFKTFITNKDLEPVPRTRNAYALNRDAQRQYLDRLSSDRTSNPESWEHAVEIFNDLLSYNKEDDPQFALDRLALLIAVNPDKAQEKFEALYKEADQRFDMARCNDVLQTLENRFWLVPTSSPLANSVKKNRQYYSARQLYLTDYYQTTTYFERPINSLNLDRFFHDAAPDATQWIFHVYATGGLGKTMFVRWLISRYCLPEPNRIHVARLDFDLLNLEFLSLHPLLLLLDIAEQLDQQIERRPFQEKFSRMWKFRPLLKRSPPSVDRTSLEAQFDVIETSWNQTALQEFRLALSDVQFTGPIVIAIDTLEEMLLLNRSSLASVIQLVKELHESYKSIRLVLSGRYDLREELPELKELLTTEAISYEVQRFTKSDARYYLTQKRGLSDPEYVEAIAEKCADKKEQLINPFILSLMTDLVTSKDIKSVEEIRKYPSAEVAYMIQRIIDRLKDFDIRWMLRYAVIPRVLTLDILEKVLWKHLIQEREKQRGKDLNTPPTAEKFDQKDYWQYGESASTAAQAWEKLKPFVTSYGWISLDKTDPGQLRLHSEVVVPMRYLLAQEDIFLLLHKDAMRYFAERADNDPPRAHTWLAEALYHCFQGEGPAAVDYWRQQLAKRPRLQSNMEARRSFAKEITGRDYVDEQGLPIKWPKQPETSILSLEDLCEANQEAAAVSIMLAAKQKETSSYFRREWSQASEHLLKLRALLKGPDKPVFAPYLDVNEYLELAEQLKNSPLDYNTAIERLERALEKTISISLSLALRVQLAEMYSSIGSERAAFHFSQAVSASTFLKGSFISPLTVRLKLARWYHDQMRYKEAIAEYNAALRETKANSKDARSIQHQLAQIHLHIGQPTAAADLCTELIESARTGTTDNFDNQILFSRIQSREFYRPRITLTSVRSLFEFAKNRRADAAVTELEGLILAQLMEFKEAGVLLDRAKELWSNVSDETGPDRTRLYRIELHLDQVGDLREISSLLDAWQRYGAKRNSDIDSQMEVLWMRFAQLQDSPGGAESVWRDAVAAEKSPAATARLMSAALALGLGNEETVKQLLDALEQVEPSSARLPLLSPFRFAKQNVIDAAPSDLRRLPRLIQWPVERREAFSSIILFADVLRFCGMTERLDDLLDQAINRALKQNELFALVQLLSVLNRTASHSLEPPDLNSTSFFDEYREFPGICYAALLEQAERQLTRAALDQAQLSLTNAKQYLRPDSVSKWDAFAECLNGKLQLQRGEQRRATVYFNSAASIYRELGDYDSVKLMREQVPVTAEPEPWPLLRLDNTWTLKLEAYRDDFKVGLIGGAEQFKQTIPATDFLKMSAVGLKERSYILKLASRFSDDPKQARWELAKQLLDTGVVDYLRGSKPAGLRLDLSPNIAKLPWEWIINEPRFDLSWWLPYVYRCSIAEQFDNDAIKWIQLALRTLSNQDVKIDGFLGPQLIKQLNEFGFPPDASLTQISDRLCKELRERRSSSRIKVLVVTASHETRIVAMRGSGGRSAVTLYGGTEVRLLEVNRTEKLADQLAYAIRSFEPQLIHIESSYTESPISADVYLDFNVRPDAFSESRSGTMEISSDYVQISTTLLSDLLSALPASILRPLIVLEGQSAPGSSTVQQMFLRNTFATELFSHGKTGGVIATGLLNDSLAREALFTRFASVLTAGYAVANAVRRMVEMFQSRNRTFEFPSWPVFFTNNPLITLFPESEPPSA